MNRRYAPLVGFLYVVLSSSIVHSMSTVGDYVEHAIKFISPVAMFFVVVALYSKYKNLSFFNKLECKVIAVSYVLITLLEYMYPVLRYWDQNFGSAYYSLFLVELGINAAIARVIIK